MVETFKVVGKTETDGLKLCSTSKGTKVEISPDDLTPVLRSVSAQVIVTMGFRLQKGEDGKYKMATMPR